jgi:hypothetical protein
MGENSPHLVTMMAWRPEKQRNLFNACGKPLLRSGRDNRK